RGGSSSSRGYVRTAARITSTGAGTPVQSSKLLAPCRTSASRPSTTSQPAARAAATSAVSPGSSIEYARSTTTCPAFGCTSSSSRTGVALTIRSHPSASGGQTPDRVYVRVSAGNAGASASAAPPAPITQALVASIPASTSLSVLKPRTRPSRRTSVFT